MLRFLLADDHTIVRRGLKQIVLEEFPHAFVDEVDNGKKLLNKVLEEDWDIVISDLLMPEKPTLEVLYDIKKIKPKLPFLIISIHPEEQYAIRALKAGASGYLTKDMAPEELIKAMNHIMSGKTHISPTLLEQLTYLVTSNSKVELHSFLSDREFNVFKLIAEGKSIAQVASLLSLSPSTVSTYRTRILIKMKLKTNADLTIYATQKNIL